MEQKKEMSLVLAVVICLLFLGVLIFISINKKTTMDTKSADEGVELSQSETAQAGDVVAMNYTGRLEDGTVFDSNVDPKFQHVEPFIFNLGAGQVIPGWDKGIVGMKVGDKKTLTIAPEDAYGPSGVPGVIPPNSTLVFEVELLAIKKQ
jgi:FKBP-type peptidyl-prolyl cis-trans isomerase